MAEFMLQTGLLGQFRHVEIELEPPNRGNENDLLERSSNGTGVKTLGRRNAKPTATERPRTNISKINERY